MIGVVRPLDHRLRVPKRDAEVFELVILFDFENVAVERNLGRSHRVFRRRYRQFLLVGLQLQLHGGANGTESLAMPLQVSGAVAFHRPAASSQRPI